MLPSKTAWHVLRGKCSLDVVEGRVLPVYALLIKSVANSAPCPRVLFYFSARLRVVLTLLIATYSQVVLSYSTRRSPSST